jgi:hypothetical protein
MNSRLLGIIGAILLIVGIFCPIVSLFGISISYFDSFRMNSGAIDGFIIAGLGVISLIIALLNKNRILIVTGILALGVMAIDFFNFKSKMSAASSVADSELSTTLANAVQLQWGWIVLVLGGLLLIVAGIIKKSVPVAAPGYGMPPPPPPPGYTPGPPPPPYNR